MLPYEILATYHWSFSGIRTPKNSNDKSLVPGYFYTILTLHALEIIYQIDF